MSRRRKVMLTLVVVFIVVNGLLVYLDDDNKVARTSYIHEWSKTFQKDMYETIETEGVLASANEKSVYFDENKGSFKEFLVEKGTKINVGDGLYTYEVGNYYETKASLESEQSRLNGEIQAIEQAIAAISGYRIPNTDFSADYDNEKASLEIKGQAVDANYRKEQYLVEKQTELAQKESQLQSIQSQFSELESTGEMVTVESPYKGKVTETSESLQNPVVSIRDLKLQAQGELTENERMKVDMDMPVEIAIKEKEDTIEGTFANISDSPKTTSIHGASLYPFEATLEGDVKTEELLPGLHAGLSIITKESLGTTAVQKKHVFGKNFWKMTTKGTLHKQKIKTGIETELVVEVTKGAKPGEWVADEDESQFRDAATFITPLKLDNIQWKQLGKYDNVSWEKYFVTGLLSR